MDEVKHNDASVNANSYPTCSLELRRGKFKVH